MKLTRSDIAIAIFAMLLFLIYYIHVTYFSVDVVFMLRLLTAYWLLAGYAFAISIPTVFDRCLSFYILEKIQ
jgi:hypothetical protein